ncbi:uncharacterized protein EV420DRAFT_682784 [Desarmillaria tabescens]|uniref:Uncharacterized protein n=1 Tax=Armillaria tabescens TaxID=1929756 RepID=A0AA39K445_ARMTA|nr:uncharacterized protein EV420DRAFT_682784 [Desarmillaria tabescens]KAK0452829.1 hypothetical protein EV420DRAFT_682784 [Desarmillaria tabescens]
MNKFPSGSRVFFYSSTGNLMKGVVESTTHAANGTQMITIKCDNGATLTLPSASVFKE